LALRHCRLSRVEGFSATSKAENIRQESFLLLWKKRGKNDMGASIGEWVRTRSAKAELNVSLEDFFEKGKQVEDRCQKSAVSSWQLESDR
jgi:hypothetical protein